MGLLSRFPNYVLSMHTYLKEATEAGREKDASNDCKSALESVLQDTDVQQEKDTWKSRPRCTHPGTPTQVQPPRYTHPSVHTQVQPLRYTHPSVPTQGQPPRYTHTGAATQVHTSVNINRPLYVWLTMR